MTACESLLRAFLALLPEAESAGPPSSAHTLRWPPVGSQLPPAVLGQAAGPAQSSPEAAFFLACSQQPRPPPVLSGYWLGDLKSH